MPFSIPSLVEMPLKNLPSHIIKVPEYKYSHIRKEEGEHFSVDHAPKERKKSKIIPQILIYGQKSKVLQHITISLAVIIEHMNAVKRKKKGKKPLR